MTMTEAGTRPKAQQPAKPAVANRPRKYKKHPAEWYIVISAIVVVFLLAVALVGAFKWFDHQRALDARENTRNTAEQVLRARVTDASISPPIQIQKVEWNGDDLAVSFVQGDKSCMGKVILPTSGQQYGIARIDKVVPEQRSEKQYYCSTVSSSDGLNPMAAPATSVPAKNP